MTEPNKKTVAVIGASTDRSKFGNKAVRAYLKQGWEVFPVSVKADTIEGLQAYNSVRDLPVHMNRVTVYLPPSIGIRAIEDIAAIRPDEVFLNPGAESDKLIVKARSLDLDPIVACSILEIGEQPD